MINAQRGETAIEIGGEAHMLRLTLAALAEIETGLGCDGLEALGERLKRLDAAGLKLVLAALLRGGGADEADTLAGLAGPRAAAAAVADCFRTNLT
ncbi:MAG: GTA-gp10 family protein [Oceanicaulis sp.]